MDRMGNEGCDKVLVLGATNVPWEIDSAMRRRFEKRVYIPLPDEDARTSMIKIHVGDTSHCLSEGTFDGLGRLTVGASGSDIKNLVKDALMEPVRRCLDAQQIILGEEGEHWMPCNKYPNCGYCPQVMSTTTPCEKCGAKWIGMEDVPPEMLREPDLCKDDFRRALCSWTKSVHKDSLKKYMEFTETFGSDGN